MPFQIPIDDARKLFPDYTFVTALTASEQKAAFHVRSASGEELCLKIVNPNFGLDRLPREVEAMLRVNHPNVVEFVEYNFTVKRTGSLHYIIEKFIEGTDLSTELGRAWDTARAAQVFSELLDGLDELKKANIVHRDLKPSNIRMRADGKPVVIDFGLARHLDLPDITKTGTMVGTPFYFAPEQFTGDRRLIDHRTDLFPVGLLLYYALVGRHPFESAVGDFNTLADAIRGSEDHFNHPDFANLPNGWKIVVKKLLSKQREGRFNDAAQAATAIRKVGGLA
jgi:serine/threonine-protein kinase